MTIQDAAYIGSFPTLEKCPEPKLPEYALIGRSNVGKSSLLNCLCGRKDLARISKKPGKTEAINFYLIDNSWYFVDLPGYGYARRSKGLIRSFGKMITEYLLYRPTLQCALVLIDSNVPPQPKDIEFVNWLGENQVPFVLVFTKTDKLKTQKSRENPNLIKAELLKHWNELPDIFMTSSVTGEGREELLNFIEEINNQTVQQ
jgi:GTP-binding protein